MEEINGKSIIPIDDEIKKFYNHVSYNERIIFSAKFGDGKSYFLDHFFESYKEEYYCIKIYPVNYQVEDNKDIFELIKRDILIQLLGNNLISDENIIDDAMIFQYEMAYGDHSDFILDLLKYVPRISMYVSTMQKALPFLKKYNEKRKELRKTDQDKAEEYLQKLEFITGSCEFDCISELITRCINQLKASRKRTVLLIEDLDRIDPAHMFRILNILTAHIDRVLLPSSISREHDCNLGMNKFNFDHIITVCDYDKVKATFHHFYGNEANFTGYISKFISSTHFTYSIYSTGIKYFREKASEIFDIPESILNEMIKYWEDHPNTHDIKKISIRELIKYLTPPDNEIIPSSVCFNSDLYFNSINRFTKCLVLLRRMNIPYQAFVDILIINENLKESFNLVGVWWLYSCYFKDDNYIHIPSEPEKSSAGGVSYLTEYELIHSPHNQNKIEGIDIKILGNSAIGELSTKSRQYVFFNKILQPTLSFLK